MVPPQHIVPRYYLPFKAKIKNGLKQQNKQANMHFPMYTTEFL